MRCSIVLIRRLAIGLIGCSTLVGGSQAISAQAAFIEFIPPQTDEVSDPRDRPKGGGSRTICNQIEPPDLKCIEQSLVALVPQANTTQAGWGLSASATPTLWFYSPYETDSPLQAAAELTDETGEVIWQASDIQLPSQPGIFGYQIPSEANLQSGNTYRWYLTVQIDPEQPAADVILNARLRYQSAPQSVDLSAPLSVEEIQSLARQGLWYDTVTAIAQASQDNWTLWEQFLIENGFPEIIKAPIHSSTSTN